MTKISVETNSSFTHVSQILTGFKMLAENDPAYTLVINEKTPSTKGPSMVMAEYRNKRIVYDLSDGYQSLDTMTEYLHDCDYYFKRSFSREKNAVYFKGHEDKIYPLGFNYMVYHKSDAKKYKPSLKQRLKRLIGVRPSFFYTSEVFEGREDVYNERPRIIFYVRVWPKEKNCGDLTERRIELIRRLRAEFPGQFYGGVKNTAYARSVCPDLIVPNRKTNKAGYIKQLHHSDICIGSAGLFQSIGWKTGEYVAAGKAIVAERFEYEVTGDFTEGENYLAFETADECISAVKRLIDDPALMKRMKKNNRDYYNKYLRPDVLVKNTLDIVDRDLKEKTLG